MTVPGTIGDWFDAPWWILWNELKMVAGSCALFVLFFSGCFFFFLWAWQQAPRRPLTQALVGGVPGGPGPGSVLVERVTPLAVVSRCVVLADAEQPAPLAHGAVAGVAVTLTPKETVMEQSIPDWFQCTLANVTLDTTKWAFLSYFGPHQLDLL